MKLKFAKDEAGHVKAFRVWTLTSLRYQVKQLAQHS